MTFNETGLKEALLKAVEELGFTEPTRVQKLAIPKVLAGKDLIVMAKTGSGKTGAFGLPLINQVTEDKTTQALILAPTRELAVQVEKDLRTMSKHSKIQSTAVYGQHNMRTEVEQLQKGKQIVVGTPGRVLHHIKERNLKTKGIQYLVLDEADRMLDMGFIDQMVKIIKQLPTDRVTMLFSATMPPEIQRMSRSYMKEPEVIELDSDTKTVDSIKQGYYRLQHNEKRTQLARLLTVRQPKSCMIFCNTRIEVDKVNDYLNRKGFLAESIHGANTQNKRMRTINEFKNADIQILVATDVAARGIHIDDMELVINYDVPLDKDNYIHRVGRTGRAGSGGQALTLVTSDDLFAFYEIEEHAGVLIDELDLPTDEEVEANAGKNEYWEKKKAERLAKRPKHENVAKKHSQSKPRGKGGQRSNHRDHGKSHHKSQGNKPDPRKHHENKSGQKKHHDNKPGQRKHPENKPVQKKQQGQRPQHARPNQPNKQHVSQKPLQQPVQAQVAKDVKASKPVQPKKKFSLKNLFKRK